MTVLDILQLRADTCSMSDELVESVNNPIWKIPFLILFHFLKAASVLIAKSKSINGLVISHCFAQFCQISKCHDSTDAHVVAASWVARLV